MNNEKFYAKKHQGDIGEEFFLRRHNELLIHPIALLLDMNEWNVEGSDMAGERLMWRKTRTGDLDGIEREAFSPYLQYGGVEIKSLGFDQFLPRYGIGNLLCGTLGVPIWGGTEDLPGGRTGYLREAHGNLRRWMEPTVENQGSRPMILIHLLKTTEVDIESCMETDRFFAAVVFEDVDALLDRITEYLRPFGLDLTNWQSIPVGQEARDLKINGLYLQGNMVQIPLSVIGDLVTVTMIGEDPTIYYTGKCDVFVQYQRLEYLKELSGGRWIPQEKPDAGIPSDVKLKDLWHRKMLLGHAEYPGLLDRDGRPI